MTTLVLSNHIAAIEDALARVGKPVLVCMTKNHAQLRGEPDSLAYPAVSISRWDAFDELACLAQQLCGQIDRVATRWEGAIVAAGFLRDLLGLPGQDMATAVRFTDKAVMKHHLRCAEVPVARHCVVHDVPAIAQTAQHVGGWPVVVKPLKGFACTNTYVIESAAELARLQESGLFDTPVSASALYADEPAFAGLMQQGAVLVEEYLDIVAEYHCDGLWLDGEPVYNIPGLYHTPPLQGMGGMLGSVLLDGGSEPGSFVVDLAHRAAKALNIDTGFTHAEVCQTRDGRWLVGEIAARPGGGGIQQAIRHAYGIDVPMLLGQQACGETFTVTMAKVAGHVGWAGPPVPPGRIVEVASRDEIMAMPGVIDASVAAKPGGAGGRTGTGLWGGLAGYAYLHAENPQAVLALMKPATDRYRVRVEPAPESTG